MNACFRSFFSLNFFSKKFRELNCIACTKYSFANSQKKGSTKFSSTIFFGIQTIFCWNESKHSTTNCRSSAMPVKCVACLFIWNFRMWLLRSTKIWRNVFFSFVFPGVYWVNECWIWKQIVVHIRINENNKLTYFHFKKDSFCTFFCYFFHSFAVSFLALKFISEKSNCSDRVAVHIHTFGYQTLD